MAELIVYEGRNNRNYDFSILVSKLVVVNLTDTLNTTKYLITNCNILKILNISTNVKNELDFSGSFSWDICSAIDRYSKVYKFSDDNYEEELKLWRELWT